jgi:hypothetical protein
MHFSIMTASDYVIGCPVSWRVPLKLPHIKSSRSARESYAVMKSAQDAFLEENAENYGIVTSDWSEARVCSLDKVVSLLNNKAKLFDVRSIDWFLSGVGNFNDHPIPALKAYVYALLGDRSIYMKGTT